jgi:hypothetical protein
MPGATVRAPQDRVGRRNRRAFSQGDHAQRPICGPRIAARVHTLGAYRVVRPDGEGIPARLAQLGDDAIRSIALGVERDPDDEYDAPDAPAEFPERLRAWAESCCEFLDPEDRSLDLPVDVQ